MSFLIYLFSITTFLSHSSQVQLSYTKLSDTKGFRTKVYESNGEPVIAFGNDKDNQNRVYCLQFIELFEASSYNLESGQYNQIPNTDIEFDDDITKWNYFNQINNRTFIIQTNSIKNQRASLMEFIFEINQITSKNHGLKFSFNLDDYKFKDINALLILRLQLRFCPDFNVDSNENSIDEDNNNDRRLISDDSDSTEYELDIAVFKNTPYASKICNNTEYFNNLTVNMYETMIDKDTIDIDLIYDNFYGCDLKQDPYVFIDMDKLDNKLKPWQIILIVLGIMVVIVGVWFCRRVYKARKMERYQNIDAGGYKENNKNNKNDVRTNSIYGVGE